MVDDSSQWNIPDCSGRLDGMDEKIISIIRNGTRSHRLLLLDCVPGHSESIVILIQYSCKILVNVTLPSGSPTWITNSTLAPHSLRCIDVSGMWCFSGDVRIAECRRWKWIDPNTSEGSTYTEVGCWWWLVLPAVHDRYTSSFGFISTVCDVSEVVLGILLLWGMLMKLQKVTVGFVCVLHLEWTGFCWTVFVKSYIGVVTKSWEISILVKFWCK